jgi:hypothetical protein
MKLFYIFSTLAIFSLWFSCAGGENSSFEAEICDDNIDNDGDLQIDCFDDDCVNSVKCINSNNQIEICTDLIDNDGDGVVDCDDADCQSSPACNTSEICTDLQDNDGDGKIDCFDSDCDNDPACATNNTNNTNNTNTEICNDNIDNDNDGDIDCTDSDCSSDPNCQTTEICNDFIDNDGDGNTDCNDTDCSSDPNCQATECSLDTLFFDSPATCSAGYKCGVDASYQAICNEDSTFAGGTFYNSCGANSQCPFGSICANDGINPSKCMPFCQMTSHPNCPLGGSCLYGLENSTLNLCDLLQSCTIVPNSCTSGKGCYLTGPNGDTGCFTSSNVAIGQACASSNDCVPEAGCFVSGTTGQCYEICRKAQGNTDCSSGTCQDTIGDATYGICQ